MNTTVSPRTLLAVRWERELVERSIVLYRLQNMHHACDRTYRPIRNGYEDVERLYRWCHRNESRIWAWVETYRLNHDIE